MTSPKRSFIQTLGFVVRRLLGWLLTALGFLCRVLLIGWGTGAIYYSNLPWPWLRTVLAIAFLGFGIWAVWLNRSRLRKRMLLVYAGLYLGVMGWWSTIKPSHDRPWKTEVSVMPRALIDGDRVKISGYRHFDYRSTEDFTARWEEREILLPHLTSVDFYISYWTLGPVGHTFVSFNFDNAPPLCVSIETRPEIGEGFNPVASIFKEFELIYVVGDERDLVGVRTTHRKEDVFLYQTLASPEQARRLLLIYLERINQLADHPEFYHLLSNSCTINIVRYANLAGRQGRMDFRHLLNGLIDQYLYLSGVLDSTLPFAELRAQSRINDAALAAGDDPNFSKLIRASLPPRRALPAP